VLVSKSVFLHRTLIQLTPSHRHLSYPPPLHPSPPSMMTRKLQQNTQKLKRRRENDVETPSRATSTGMHVCPSRGRSSPSQIQEITLSPIMPSDPVPTRQSMQGAGKTPIMPPRYASPAVRSDEEYCADSAIRKRLLSSHRLSGGRKRQTLPANGSRTFSREHSMFPVRDARTADSTPTRTLKPVRNRAGTPIPSAPRIPYHAPATGGTGHSEVAEAQPKASPPPHTRCAQVIAAPPQHIPDESPVPVRSDERTARYTRGWHPRMCGSTRENAWGPTNVTGSVEGGTAVPPSRSSSQEVNRELRHLLNSLKQKIKDRDATLQMANLQAKAMTMAFEELKEEVRILRMEIESLKVKMGVRGRQGIRVRLLVATVGKTGATNFTKRPGGVASTNYRWTCVSWALPTC